MRFESALKVVYKFPRDAYIKHAHARHLMKELQLPGAIKVSHAVPLPGLSLDPSSFHTPISDLKILYTSIISPLTTV